MKITIEKGIEIPNINEGNIRNNNYQIVQETLESMQVGDSFLLSCEMVQADKLLTIKSMISNINGRLKNRNYRASFRQVSKDTIRVWKINKNEHRQ